MKKKTNNFHSKWLFLTIIIIINSILFNFSISGVSGASTNIFKKSNNNSTTDEINNDNNEDPLLNEESTESIVTTVESVDKDLPNFNSTDDSISLNSSVSASASTATTTTTDAATTEEEEDDSNDNEDSNSEDEEDEDYDEDSTEDSIEKKKSDNDSGMTDSGDAGEDKNVEEDSDDYYTSNNDDEDDDDDDDDEDSDEEYEEERCTLKSFLSTMNITEMFPTDRNQLIQEYESFGEDPREKIRVAPSVNHTFARLNRLMSLVRNIASQQEIRSGLTNFLHHNFDLFLELDLGPECLNAIIAILVAIRRNELWALKFFDSAPKLPSGLLTGVGSYLGSFDQCLSISNPDTYSENYSGQYCIIKPLLPLPDKPKIDLDDAQITDQTERILSFYSHYNVDQYMKTNPILKFVEIMKSNKGRVTNFAICLPDSCSAEQLESSLNKFLYPIIGIPLEIQESSCWTEKKTKDYSLYIDGFATFALLTIGTFSILVLLATIYDLYPWFSLKNNHNYHPHRHHLNEQEQNRRLSTRMVIKSSSSSFSRTTNKILDSFVSMFSAVGNTRKLLVSSSSISNRLMVLDTLRLILIILIGLCNAFYNPPLSQALHNISQSVPHELLSSSKYFFIRAPSLLNDGLLIIAGALFVRSIFSHLIRPHDTLTYLLYFLQRWIRLTLPVFGSILFLYLLPSTGYGPLWHRLVEILMPPCTSPSSIASTIFHYSNWNFVKSNYTNDEAYVVCNPDTWFISIIFQLNIAFFMIVLLMYQSPKKGLRLLIIFIIASVLFNISPRLFFSNTRTYYELMRQPSLWHIRRSFYLYHQNIIQYIGSFSVGLLLGYAIIVNENVTKDPKSNNQSRIQKKTLIYNFLAMIGIALPFVWVNQFFKQNQPVNELSVLLFFSIGRFIFSLSFAWIIYVCVSKKSPILHSLLTPEFIQPIARLSFAIFLVQPLVQYHRIYSIKETYVQTFRNTIEHYICDFLISIILAYLLYLLFEGPAIQLNRLLQKKLQQRRTSQNNDDSDSDSDHTNKNDYWCEKDKINTTPTLSDGLDLHIQKIQPDDIQTKPSEDKNEIISIRF